MVRQRGPAAPEPDQRCCGRCFALPSAAQMGVTGTARHTIARAAPAHRLLRTAKLRVGPFNGANAAGPADGSRARCMVGSRTFGPVGITTSRRSVRGAGVPQPATAGSAGSSLALSRAEALRRSVGPWLARVCERRMMASRRSLAALLFSRRCGRAS